MSEQAARQPYRQYVGGEWTDGAGTETFESNNPATGETLATFQRSTVDTALEIHNDTPYGLAGAIIPETTANSMPSATERISG